MKASGIFSLVSLAVSAMAIPILNTVTDTTKKVTDVTQVADGAVPCDIPVAGDMLDQVSADDLLAKLPVGTDLDSIISRLPVNGAGVVDNVAGKESKVKDAEGVIVIIKTAVHKVKKSTTIIQSTLTQIKGGKVDKTEGDAQVTELIKGINIDLTEIITSLTGQAGIPVSAADCDRVIVLINVLIKELLTTAKAIITCLGLSTQISTLLHSVFILIAKILVLLISILDGILPGLVTALCPILSGLGNDVLGPTLSPVVLLVAGIVGV